MISWGVDDFHGLFFSSNRKAPSKYLEKSMAEADFPQQTNPWLAILGYFSGSFYLEDDGWRLMFLVGALGDMWDF